MIDISKYCPEYLLSAIPQPFEIAKKAATLDEFRREIADYVHTMHYEMFDDDDLSSESRIIRVRDCARAINMAFIRQSEEKAQFSISQAISDISYKVPRPDLSPAFYAEILYLFLGLQGKGPNPLFADSYLEPSRLEGREAALERSDQLDALSVEMYSQTNKYTDGLNEDSVNRRGMRKKHILQKLGATSENWKDWRWQFQNVLRDVNQIKNLLNLTPDEAAAIEKVRNNKIPFGITPYYLSLMDDDPDSGRDRSIRAQVIPPSTYIEQLASRDDKDKSCFDFMCESDTSPIDLITRRYPEICIFKPFNTCPQICVYCQRNWEIEDAMMPGALASDQKIMEAVSWIKAHPAIHEVLITGGDPFGMNDYDIDRIIALIADIPSVDRIRIGTRTLVTTPMRLTDTLADILAKYRIPGKRQVAVVTHVQHAYELTPETLAAIEKLRIRGIPVFNQLVYTFFVSRRFEAAFLRKTLTNCGIEPYYTFNTKGKEETIEYRVPIARLLQEQKEEARLFPGLVRTDEAVYNVPGMGKNYLRAVQHRDLISILPDGSRLYQFHPWEKNITKTLSTYIGQDVPILDYLNRLEDIGENTDDYSTIWYYF